jgi:hypothetical protein
LLPSPPESDLEIGAVTSEVWNVMGRPKQSIDYDLIVNGGKSVWTDGDPAKQPAMMSLLAQNIRGSSHPKLADKKEDWAKRIEAKAAAQAEAAKPAEASYARVTFLTMQRRTLVVRHVVIREPCFPTVTSMASVPGHAASPSCSIALWPTCF